MSRARGPEAEAAVRVGYLVSQYPATSHTFIRREVEELRRRGAEVHTFSLRRAPDSEIPAEADRREAASTGYVLPVGVATLIAAHAAAAARRPAAYLATLALALSHRLPGARAALWGLFHFAEAILLARELERRGLRHLHAHFANAGADVGLLAARFLGIDWSLSLHGACDFEYPAAPLLPGKLAAARFVACVSGYGRSQALRALSPADWGKVLVSRCGVDVARIDATRRPRARGSRLRVVSVGRLAPEKAQTGLLEAFAGARKAGVDAELVIVGEGPERARLEAFKAELGLSECCALPGRATEAQVFEALRGADVFVLSSLMEGLPVSLVEAMAAGVPVIAPRLAGIPEVVVHGETGLLYTPGGWEELGLRIAELARDPELGARLASAARARVERDFDLASCVEPLWQRLRDGS